MVGQGGKGGGGRFPRSTSEHVQQNLGVWVSADDVWKSDHGVPVHGPSRYCSCQSKAVYRWQILYDMPAARQGPTLASPKAKGVDQRSSQCSARPRPPLAPLREQSRTARDAALERSYPQLKSGSADTRLSARHAFLLA